MIRHVPMRKREAAFLAALGWLAVAAAMTGAAEPGAPRDPPASEPMRLLLAEKIDLDLQKIPLDDVLKYLAEARKGLRFVIDPSLAEAKIDLKTRAVDIRVRQVPIESALKALLTSDLRYRIEADGVRIMTHKRYLQDLSPVTYPLDKEVLRAAEGPSSGAPQGTAALVPLVTRLVNNTGNPDVAAWASEGGAASIVPLGDSLTVRQTPRGHERIREVIEALGRVAAAEAGKPPAAPQESSELRDTRRRLAEAVDLDFEKTGLDNVLLYLSDVKKGLNLVIDPDVAAAGIDLSTRVVDLNVKGVAVEEVLRIVLGPDLAHRAEPGYVMITAREKLYLGLPLAPYSAKDLLARRGRVPGEGSAQEELREVVAHAVSNMVDPEVAAWQDEGGDAALESCGNALLITQKPRGHERIADLLARLSQAFQGSPAAAGLHAGEPPAIVATRRLLEEPIDLDVEKVSLDNLLKYLAQVKKGLNLVAADLPSEGIDLGERRVTFKEKQCPIRKVLDTTLGKDLGYVVRPGYVLIETRERADRASLALAAYPVADLLGRPAEKGGLRDRARKLIDDVQKGVNPKANPRVMAWADEGGPASVQHFAGVLIVVQTPEGHRLVKDFLAQRGAPKEGPAAPADAK